MKAASATVPIMVIAAYLLTASNRFTDPHCERLLNIICLPENHHWQFSHFPYYFELCRYISIHSIGKSIFASIRTLSSRLSSKPLFGTAKWLHDSRHSARKQNEHLKNDETAAMQPRNISIVKYEHKMDFRLD